MILSLVEGQAVPIVVDRKLALNSLYLILITLCNSKLSPAKDKTSLDFKVKIYVIHTGRILYVTFKHSKK